MTDLIKHVQKFTDTEDKTVFEVIHSLEYKYAHYSSIITENGIYGTDQYYLKHANPEIRQMWIDIRIINALIEEIEELIIWIEALPLLVQ